MQWEGKDQAPTIQIGLQLNAIALTAQCKGSEARRGNKQLKMSHRGARSRSCIEPAAIKSLSTNKNRDEKVRRRDQFV